MNTSNKKLKQEYKQAIRPMGVFQIRNLVNEKIFVVGGIDLAGAINRHKFALGAGGHQNQLLQKDWNNQGADRFAFETLDQMNPSDNPRDSRKDLAFLEQMWIEKLQPFGERGYNERKLNRDEMLRQMAARRVDET
jgi:hypothetical protein